MVEDMDKETRLRQERRRQGLSQTQVAARAGLHPANISAIETLRSIPSPTQRERLARVLSMSEDALFGDIPTSIPLIREDSNG